MRDEHSGKTLQLDAALAPIAEPGEEESEVGFQAASSDGTRVFFTDTARLTEESKLAPLPGCDDNPADLYECEIVEEARNPTCNLSDLTVDQQPGRKRRMCWTSCPRSAKTAPTSTSSPTACSPLAPLPAIACASNTEAPAPGATCSLYVWHEGASRSSRRCQMKTPPTGGAREAVINGGESSIEPRQDLADVTAGASPDGEYLAFMSDQPPDRAMTTSTRAPRPKARATRRSTCMTRSTKLLVCASCNPSGDAAAWSVRYRKGRRRARTARRPPRKLGLLAESRARRPLIGWRGASPAGHRLGGQASRRRCASPRYLSDSGRLFFDSADRSSPSNRPTPEKRRSTANATQVGVESVYEYEPNGRGSCEQ